MGLKRPTLRNKYIRTEPYIKGLPSCPICYRKHRRIYNNDRAEFCYKVAKVLHSEHVSSICNTDNCELCRFEAYAALFLKKY